MKRNELYSQFEKEHDLKIRKKESSRIMGKHDRYFPVIAECLPGDKNMKYATQDNPNKKRFLVSGDLALSQFQMVLRQRLCLAQTDAIIIFCKNKTIPLTSETINTLYNDYVADDGFLYLFYGTEAVFGYNS